MAQQQIFFHYLEVKFSFAHRNILKKFLLYLCKKEGRRISRINYIFCQDESLLSLNQTHLKHDTLTDIITFQYNRSSEPLKSDIYISIQRVKENSSIYQVSFNQELHRVIFHGLLHLCSYTDKTKAEKAIMTDKENYYLNSYFVSRETL